MVAVRCMTPTRRAPAHRRASVLLLAGGFVAFVLVLVAVESWWQVEPTLNRRRASALFHHPLHQRPTSAKRAFDYLLEAAAWEAPSYPQACRERYHGLPFLRTINASWQQPVCTPQAAGPLNSSISCWFQFDRYSEAYCTGANLALDLVKFEEEEASIPRQTSNRGDDGGFKSYKRLGVPGELVGDCQLHGKVAGEDKWQEDSFGHGGQEWLYRSFKSSLGEAQQPRCVAWVSHPAYFLNDKYDSLNPWHALEDVTHAFEAYALKGWGREAQVIVLDQVTPQSVLGPTYLAVWEKAFSPLHPPALLRTLAEEAAAKAKAAGGGQLPPGAALCFTDAFFSVHGGISLLSRSIAAWTPCPNSTTVNAMVRFMLDGLRLSDVRPASHAALLQGAQGQQQAGQGQQQRLGQGQQQQQQQQPPGQPREASGRMRVVWALRSTRAGFQREMLDALQERIPKETGAEVVAVEFGGLSMEEQIRRVRQADVLAGYHGAALTLALYMSEPSGLVEVEGSFRCTCYTNCALWRAHPYTLIKTSEFAEKTEGDLVERVVEAVKEMLGRVAKRIQDGA